MYRLHGRVQGCELALRIHERDLFVPNLMSWLSAAQMHVFPGETFCDVGCGSGLHAILAAKLGARRAYGTDISETAVRLARANARLNHVDDICRFFQGSLVDPLLRRGIRVDVLIYNAPQFPGRLVDPGLPVRLQESVNGGPGGGDLNARFIREAWEALKPRGRIYNPIVDWASPQLSQRAIRESGWKAYEILRVNIPVWGRGNHTRAWFLKHPGTHHFLFRHARGQDTTARVLELRKDEMAPVSPRKPLPVDVEFRMGWRARRPGRT